MKRTADFLVIGAGVIGINVSRLLKARYPDCSIVLIDKEDAPGKHASGRNSGVLHAGFYYTANSFKAKFCREGNQMLTEYCVEKNIPLNRCGKLVVASHESDLVSINELLVRGRNNGVALLELDEKEAREIEPRVRTFKKALYSPTTATVSPSAVICSMAEDAIGEGVDLFCGAKFISKEGRSVRTSKGVIETGYVVNTAGLYADKIAMNYGFSESYRILPFKGLYLYGKNNSASLRTNVYPVPDLNYPFLGVHFTVDVHGKTKIGPTAIPAFWREHYDGLDNFNFLEFLDVLGREAGFLIRNDFGFRKVAVEEIKKNSKRKMIKIAERLVNGIANDGYSEWGKPGIRAQLVDIRNKRLEMDFVCEGDDRSFHVLNTVSPGFTCSLPFSSHIVDQITSMIC